MIGIVDYGLGNLRSVENALLKLGTQARVVANPEDLCKFPRIIIPGVGAFKEGMANLRRSGLDESILEYKKTGKPILGICLGYQILALSSTEFGLESGLGLLRAECRGLEPSLGTTLPHIGWNTYQPTGSDEEWMLKDRSFYFVHSYGVFSEMSFSLSAKTIYGGQEFLSLIRHENILGVQFHPEKSGKDGLEFLKSFIEWG
jgi:glutamine amidotransferase